MPVTKIKRSQVQTFINTTPLSTATYVLIGDGIVSGAIQYNPKVTEEIYVINDSASISVDSYAPKMPVEGSAKKGDAVYDYLDALRKARGVLSAAEAEVCNVWLYETGVGGWYPAERQLASLQVDEFGGEGGVAAKVKYTVNFIGAAELGIMNPTPTITFDGVPVTTILTTMVIGSVTLTPLFSADHSWLLYTGSVPNGTSVVSMTSTLSGSTIVQKCNGTTVNQGANASLNVGVNNLTIEVTVGSEVTTYHIDITRAAP